jgi:hypothetical protein
LEKIKSIFSIYYDILACRAPANNYSLFLLERYLLLKVKAIRAGTPSEFATVSDFVSCFKEQDDAVKYFLCELYLHNFILEEKGDENPNPFTGDVQFHAFLSFFQKSNYMGQGT